MVTLSITRMLVLWVRGQVYALYVLDGLDCSESSQKMFSIRMSFM